MLGKLLELGKLLGLALVISAVIVIKMGQESEEIKRSSSDKIEKMFKQRDKIDSLRHLKQDRKDSLRIVGISKSTGVIVDYDRINKAIVASESRTSKQFEALIRFTQEAFYGDTLIHRDSNWYYHFYIFEWDYKLKKRVMIEL